jgi:hypothetical protein
MLAQAALRNQLLDFSSIMKLYTSISLAEKQRIIEGNEQQVKAQQQQQQEQQMQLEQQKLQQQAQIAEQQQQLQYQMHQEDNETKILVAQINSQAEADRLTLMNEEQGLTRAEETAYKREELAQSAKEFEQKLALEKEKHKDEVRLKEKQIAKGISRS